DRGGRAVGVEAQGPAPPVDGDQVVEGAGRGEVPDRGRPAAGAGGEVVDLAGGGGLGAAGGRAPGVAEGHGAPQGGGGGGGGRGAVARRRAARGGRPAAPPPAPLDAGARGGGEPGGAGRGAGGQGQQRPPQPLLSRGGEGIAGGRTGSARRRSART